MTEAEWWEFENVEAMAKQIADDIEFIIKQAIEKKGRALIIVPGGSTPKLVFPTLAARDLDWSKVTLMLTDDRLVAKDNPLSNFGLLTKHFGSSGAELVSLIDENYLDDRAAAGRAADQKLASYKWPADLVWLGMGNDGHTASIFPGPNFDEAVNGPRERRALGLLPVPLPPEAPVARVTLSLSTLASAHTVMVVITGDHKRTVLTDALKEGASSRLPVGRVLGETEASIDVYWSK
ncbi:6-phosphogluconolactonase [Zymomonas mobilis subsp. mobilis ZM4 = ATCC 31821]|uniref:6-phosphogluconolactonase n=1 Tax=Zymomonas mobilis subsp. mobilis (strain ATCC 31821 / ZM4 / CP4) TaxID=264203 RepID=Q5NMF8_ZYMMO|nr:6-phosphogluconolactonase [Zymomonas mobilis]AAV90102.2 6-phosphogluconolactonase [Zymomonas mobilis subsp. mobilis ZM4 = ATCC 31821]AVZ26322.1 6-phosphogluconolactonase [Zymomonas mobilis subsp. mobilis]AVZ28209.1 6-phosphogluconolactonase [Zymomonas mobilis subsp. mobilis]AVZ42654.1 6-phosphogluconolactonase [Zymomonas mobilis subsp. mobilis ZM4 = ATCC 31821]MCP9308017.1 6-phosphogluconolactonase [Zymomonas mobilis]